MSKSYKDREWLFNQYITLKKSESEIREICEGGDIHYWLKKFSIPIRSISDAKKGKPRSEEYIRKLSKRMKGKKHWNYGKHHSKKTRRKMSDAQSGNKHHNWKGGIAFYYSTHQWIYKHFIKPELCEICNLPEYYDEEYGEMEWSNKTGKLIKDRMNWQYIHQSCHRRYDRDNKIIHEGLEKSVIKNE